MTENFEDDDTIRFKSLAMILWPIALFMGNLFVLIS